MKKLLAMVLALVMTLSLAVSANAFDEDIQRSLASGMNAHLSKPIERTKLAATLARFLK